MKTRAQLIDQLKSLAQEAKVYIDAVATSEHLHNTSVRSVWEEADQKLIQAEMDLSASIKEVEIYNTQPIIT